MMSIINILAPNPCQGATRLTEIAAELWEPNPINLLPAGEEAPVDSIALRWGVPRTTQAQRQINTPVAIAAAANKALAREKLWQLAPLTWTTRNRVQLPCVIRPSFHYGAHHFYVCRRERQINRAIARCGEGWYASELIHKTREFRVFVLHGRVVAVSERFPPADGRRHQAWNSRRGGSMQNCRSINWHGPALVAALQAAQVLELAFGAFDIVVDANEEAFVLEANSRPGFENTYTLSRIAKALRWCSKHWQPEPVPLGEWRLHPGVAKKKE